MNKVKAIAVVETLDPRDGEFRQMGEQLTRQYKLAVSGMREVLLFGAMLMQVRHLLVHEPGVVSKLDTTKHHGPQTKGMGLKAWLAEYSPEISRSTAYRFLGIAEAVAEEYASVVGKRVAKELGFVELVTAQPEALSEPARLKQLELFDYVSGTSQRSWLDRFKAEDDTPRGGKREGAGRPQGVDLEAVRQMAVQDFRLYHAEMLRLMTDKLWCHLDKEEIATLAGDFRDWGRELSAVLKEAGPGVFKPVKLEA